MNQPRCANVRISGRVQGVNFRAWTKRRASARGLAGWVRNLPDGDVEAVFCGPDADVEAMVAECWTGPPRARVTAVQVKDASEAATGPFEIRR